MEIDVTRLSSPPTTKGICIRQYTNADPNHFNGGVDTLVFLDGKFLDGVQRVSVDTSVDDVLVNVELSMIASCVDVDITDPRIVIEPVESSNVDYQLGSPNPINRQEI